MESEMASAIVEGEFFYYSDNDSEKGYPHKFKLEVEDNCCEEHAKIKAMEILQLYVKNYNGSVWAEKYGDGVELKIYE
jgi:hypothetical protein